MPIRFQFHDDPRFRAWQQRVGGRPGWVWKAAAAAAVLVVVVPLVVLTLTALVVGVAVFAVLSLISAVLRAFSELFAGSGPGGPSHPGEHRENVRIVER